MQQTRIGPCIHKIPSSGDLIIRQQYWIGYSCETLANPELSLR